MSVMRQGAGEWSTGQHVIEHKHPQESLAEYGYRLLSAAQDIDHKRRAAFAFEQALVDHASDGSATPALVRELVATALRETQTSGQGSPSPASG